MVNYQSSGKLSIQSADDLAFVPKAFSGLTGVVLGLIIANFMGII